MNWLNALDNVLEHGFVAGGGGEGTDEEHTQTSAGTGLDHSTTTWSDDGDDDDNDDDDDVIVKAKSKTDLAGTREDQINNANHKTGNPSTTSSIRSHQSITAQRTTTTRQPMPGQAARVIPGNNGSTAAARPGTIRKFHVPSSSEEESSSDDDTEKGGGERICSRQQQQLIATTAKKNTNASSKKKLLSPISLSSQDSLLKQQQALGTVTSVAPLLPTSENLNVRPQQSSSQNSKSVPAAPTTAKQNVPGRPRQASRNNNNTTKAPPPPPPSGVTRTISNPKVPGRAKPMLHNSNKISSSAPTKPIPKPNEPNVPGRPKPSVPNKDAAKSTLAKPKPQPKSKPNIPGRSKSIPQNAVKSPSPRQANQKSDVPGRPKQAPQSANKKSSSSSSPIQPSSGIPGGKLKHSLLQSPPPSASTKQVSSPNNATHRPVMPPPPQLPMLAITKEQEQATTANVSPSEPESDANLVRANTRKVDNTTKQKLNSSVRQQQQTGNSSEQEAVVDREEISPKSLVPKSSPSPSPSPATASDSADQPSATSDSKLLVESGSYRLQQQQQRTITPEKANVTKQAITPIQSNRQSQTQARPAAKEPDLRAKPDKLTEEAIVTAKNNNPSVASSNWSWSGSIKDNDDETMSQDDTEHDREEERQLPQQTETIVETSFLKKEKEQLEGELRRSAPEGVTDEEVTSLVAEIEELKALVDAVSAEDGNNDNNVKKCVVTGDTIIVERQHTGGGGDDHAVHDNPVSKLAQSASSLELMEAKTDNSLKGEENSADDFFDAPSTSDIDVGEIETKTTFPSSNVSVFPGAYKSAAEDDPSWIPQSEATLVAANTTTTNSSNNSLLGEGSQRVRVSHDASDASLDIKGIVKGTTSLESKPGQDNFDQQPSDLSIKTSSSELRRNYTLYQADSVSSSWIEDPATAELAPLNCYGVFHIRLLRAQRLPCPVGSTVQAIVSLDPWKGRSRTQRTNTFVFDQDPSSFDNGVCALWDDNQDNSSATVSLVHSYASELSPIPTIKVQLMLSPMRLIEFSMCSLAIPCHALMRCPGEPTRQWFLAEMQDAKASNDRKLFGEEQTTMVEIEAIFEPDEQVLGSSFLSIGQHHQTDDDEEEDADEALETTANDSFGSLTDSKTENNPGVEVASVKKDDDDDVAQPKKPHLLRVKKFWKPASCAQCSGSLFGWRKASFRCEACGLDSCGDCRLHLDAQIPCGSAKARKIVSSAIQNKLTVGTFLQAMAPVDESYEQKKRETDTGTTDGELSLADTRTETLTIQRLERTRIGVLKMSVAKACVFRDPLPSITDPEEVQNSKGELRPGDYYVRVCRTGTEGSSRTRTIPSGGSLQFEESSEMRLDVAYYGVEFFIEVIDALTDKPIGTSVLTTHGILQQQRDQMIEQGQMSILNVGKKPPSFKGKRRIVLDLRTEVRRGVSSDFFVPSDEKDEKGEISGWVEIKVGLEEDVKRLYGPSPSECPAPPPDSLNLSTLNLHISRISDIVEDVINLFGAYAYLVSWKSPVLTGFSFVTFLALTIGFNAEYVGCLPFLFLMVWMVSSAFARSNGNTKKRFVEEEADEWRATEKEIDVNYSLHRPVGRINIEVSKGCNIRSRELGLAGNVGCRVYWDPLRYASETQKEKILAIDKSAKTLHEVGSTESKFTTNPAWENFQQSDECRRLKQVLPHHGHFFATEEEENALDSGCEFPILQPFRKVEDDDEDDTTQHFNAVLERWEASAGAIVFQIRFRDILNMLPGSDQVFGEVVLPLSALLEKGEMSGWFQVLEVGTTMFAPVQETSSLVLPGLIDENSVVSGLTESALAMASQIPKIWLTVKWTPPEENLASIEARETDREASAVIQEELLRWEIINRDKDKLKQFVVGGSIGAFQTVSGFAGTLQVIQNFLGKLVGTIEAVRNLINFTDPYKSSMILAAVSLLWLVLSLIPTRLIILVAGLAQYGLTAKKKIEKILKNDHTYDCDDDASQASGLDEDEDEDAPIIWLKNAFRGLPTDEDLRKAYFWEGRRNGAKTRERYASEKRLARLKRLWRAQWHATVKIRGEKDSKSANGGTSWDKIFAVVQGRRFLWWKTVEEFDNGCPPLGRLFLAGHAGLSGLSPLEMREIDPKDVPFIVGIFGRGLSDQQRITLRMPSAELKDTLENAVIAASLKDD